ncbi:MAG: hypothetical protein P8X89_23165 [Reinekea sp.]
MGFFILEVTVYQHTVYRMYESGDEEGSSGFNHIVWKRLYGDEETCDSIRGYLLNADNEPGDTENINVYMPKNSILAFGVATADRDCQFSNGLFRAYSAEQTYQTNIPEADRPVSYCYKSIPTELDASCTAAGNLIEYTDTQDTGMNLPVKAMMAYNRGTRGLDTSHYFSNMVLKSRPNLNGTRFDYAMRIKQHTQEDDLDGYLPYVTYVWPGTDANNDGEPDWCFAYGEEEWLSGTTYNSTLTASW